MIQVGLHDRVDERTAILKVTWTDPTSSNLLHAFVRVLADLDDVNKEEPIAPPHIRLRALDAARELAERFHAAI